MCNQIIQTVLINPLFFCDWDLPLWWTYWGWTDSLFIWSTEIGQPAPPTSEVQPGGTGDEVQPIPGQASLVDLHRFPCTPWAKFVPVHWLYVLLDLHIPDTTVSPCFTGYMPFWWLHPWYCSNSLVYGIHVQWNFTEISVFLSGTLSSTVCSVELYAPG